MKKLIKCQEKVMKTVKDHIVLTNDSLGTVTFELELLTSSREDVAVEKLNVGDTLNNKRRYYADWIEFYDLDGEKVGHIESGYIPRLKDYNIVVASPLATLMDVGAAEIEKAVVSRIEKRKDNLGEEYKKIYVYVTLMFDQSVIDGEEKNFRIVDGFLVECIRKVKNIVIPPEVKVICSRAFNHSGMTEIVIPEMVEEIQECAFVSCKKLEKIIFEKLEKISIDGPMIAKCENLKIFEGLKGTEACMKFYINVCNLLGEGYLYDDLATCFKIKKGRIYFNSKEFLKHFNWALERKEINEIQGLKKIAESWIDYGKNCPDICYELLEAKTSRELFIVKLKGIFAEKGIPQMEYYNDSCDLVLRYEKKKKRKYDHNYDEYFLPLWDEEGKSLLIIGRLILIELFEEALKEAGDPLPEVTGSDYIDEAWECEYGDF